MVRGVAGAWFDLMVPEAIRKKLEPMGRPSADGTPEVILSAHFIIEFLCGTL